MKKTSKPYKETLRAFPSIFSRHAFLFVNGIIFSVVVLLFVFGAKQSAIFLGAITVVNIFLGVIQDTKSKYSLEQLQLITALQFVRIAGNGAEELVYADDLVKGDKIKVKLGDQIPVDGTVVESSNLEMSSALITGESDSSVKKQSDTVSAGEIITAGKGVIELGSTYDESRIAQMTKTIKEYSASESPIQEAVSKIIRFSSLVLCAVIAYVVARGLLVHQPYISIVNNIGALASVIIPQGLVVITTLLFAFGAASYSSKHVLFQEINATEKLGRIKNLCMDKTGTLTDNAFTVEKAYPSDAYSEEQVRELTAMYIQGSEDSSKTMDAIGQYVKGQTFSQKIIQSNPFSSWKQYGSVYFESNNKKATLFFGPPEVFLKRVSGEEQKTWLSNIVTEHAQKGERVLCAAISNDDNFVQDIQDAQIGIVAVYALSSGLREGIQDSIKFFQDRGVIIRVITGDNPETAVSVARLAGIKNPEAVIDGGTMKSWSDQEYLLNSKKYSVFARIIPEQKVKIIDALKHDGFTAMVGDGANDALAIKKADIGIAMFDGVPATRRLAGVILMNNSFSALPGAVSLADSFICNIEILGSLFLNQAFVGAFFFVLVSIFGYVYPILPLNITVTNYFTIGLPGVLIAYWALRPEGNIVPSNTESFIKKVLPFPLFSSLLQAGMMFGVFMLLPYTVRLMDSNIVILSALIAGGFVFFVSASKIYLGFISKVKWLHFFIAFVLEVILFAVLVNIPIIVRFFSLQIAPVAQKSYEFMALVFVGFIVLQIILTAYFSKKRLAK